MLGDDNPDEGTKHRGLLQGGLVGNTAGWDESPQDTFSKSVTRGGINESGGGRSTSVLATTPSGRMRMFKTHVATSLLAGGVPYNSDAVNASTTGETGSGAGPKKLLKRRFVKSPVNVGSSPPSTGQGRTTHATSSSGSGRGRGHLPVLLLALLPCCLPCYLPACLPNYLITRLSVS